MLESLIAQLPDGSVVGSLLGLGVGVLLGLSPVALLTIPAVLATVSRGYVYDSGYRPRTPVTDAFPSILAFTAGMNGVIGLAGYAFVTVTVALARAAVVRHLVAAVAMVVLAVRLLTRRASVCGRPGTIPPNRAGRSSTASGSRSVAAPAVDRSLSRSEAPLPWSAVLCTGC